MQLRDVLIRLDFEEDWATMTDQLPGYYFNFGNLKLSATQVTNLYLQPVFFISGMIITPRSITEISSDIPVEVESFEQGVAWIVYLLGEKFIPFKTTSWVDDGRRWSEHLPWERSRKAFEGRPQCSVERDWFRVAAKKIRNHASAAGASDMIIFRFDGEVLSIEMPGTHLAMPAQGKAWDSEYSLAATRMSALAKRIMGTTVYLGVWKGQLQIDRCCYPILPRADDADAGSTAKADPP
ncbi:hypothetical protein [Pseudoduganella albidiflava]|uniref:Uncharacterized protein n=1 Tax=Pseudoduganella albidiflava TaxID=321983 RepID=A0A411X5I0_9BURK|nr:hypothetical protein [Pseudoduganella albidiflava]QBI04143.1 hypothetical protein EYF70_27480 [Pseudoduganella albidiflava]GGY25016.1 hypothetical protein GCM10007387_03260 [Pseudoduganella albidiflava]